MTSTNMEKKLKKFLTLNPEAKLTKIENDYVIENAWSDSTISIRVSSKATELIKSLNNLRFPPRFSAIWHNKTKDLEFIYAPIGKDADERSRSFTFSFRGKDFVCEYKDASKDLNLLASAVRITAPATDTNHRNLANLRNFLRFQSVQNERNKPIKVQLTSFWIRKVNLEEEELVEFARHLNFYMHHFDRFSPMILIHEEPITEKVEKTLRYPYENFPETITGNDLDLFLLSLWESSVLSADPYRRFLYGYQIVEYAAFYYLKNEIFRAIKRILISPELHSSIENASKQILDIMVEEKADDDAKFNSVVQQCVDPAIVWKEIEPKLEFFSSPTNFDGGLSIPPLVKNDWKFEDFKTAWTPKLPDALRKIRNSLVHAREKRQSKSLSPTSKNQHLLRPWVSVMSAIASQVVLYKDL